MIKLSNPRVRSALYVAYAVLSLALGSVAVFCGASAVYALPDWVTPAGAVLAYIGSGLGFVASSNTPASAVEPEPGTASAVGPASAVEPASAVGPASAVEPEPGTVPAVEPAQAA